jgi:hypothetical protein
MFEPQERQRLIPFSLIKDRAAGQNPSFLL